MLREDLAPEAAGHTWYPNSFLAPLNVNEPWLSSALQVLGRVPGATTESFQEAAEAARDGANVTDGAKQILRRTAVLELEGFGTALAQALATVQRLGQAEQRIGLEAAQDPVAIDHERHPLRRGDAEQSPLEPELLAHPAPRSCRQSGAAP